MKPTNNYGTNEQTEVKVIMIFRSSLHKHFLKSFHNSNFDQLRSLQIEDLRKNLRNSQLEIMKPKPGNQSDRGNIYVFR